MIRSMTGYGMAEGHAGGLRIQVELKSVNNRYAEANVRLPREWLLWEDGVRRTVLAAVKRGRVDAFVTCEFDGTSARTVQVDWALAEGYMAAAKQLRARFSLPGPDKLTLQDLIKLPDLVTLSDSRDSAADETVQETLIDLTAQAVRRLIAVREAEGANLAQDVLSRLGAMERMLEEIRQSADAVSEELRIKLRQRIRDLLGETAADSPLADNRIAMEVALLAERADISEELQRLASHLQQTAKLLEADEPIGRKLDFYIQEMNREVNTIGSKSNRSDIVNAVVDMKAELEKMREQAQNIE
ncbi:YicC/YloC family endoribonuclease [Paenibacillus koleovorans]|uniref:YicC/YloC family endoribonuclease n=1 Tax=Paenibacillus koleovorans TaxID=121608 RepID=UPI000FD76830|nr:YicC/YloC family endoribonuclease [Paenibacillus koleovorans]